MFVSVLIVERQGRPDILFMARVWFKDLSFGSCCVERFIGRVAMGFMGRLGLESMGWLVEMFLKGRFTWFMRGRLGGCFQGRAVFESKSEDWLRLWASFGLYVVKVMFLDSFLGSSFGVLISHEDVTFPLLSLRNVFLMVIEAEKAVSVILKLRPEVLMKERT